MISYNDNQKLTVINFFGGPGCGKSTLSASLFCKMKLKHLKVEYVTEVAKDYTWERRGEMLTEQDYIFAKQNNRLRRLVEQVDYAITDSPLLLSLMYTPMGFPDTFANFVLDVFRSYNNVNVLLTRPSEDMLPYQSFGRKQSLDEAKEKDEQIRQFLISQRISFIETSPTDIHMDKLILLAQSSQ